MRVPAIAALLVLSTAVSADTTGAKWLSVPQLEGGHLSITFDDATKTQFSVAFPILWEAGLTATLFVNTDPLDKGDTYFMNWDNVRELQAAGWEIGAHTVTHTSLLSQGDIEVVGELVLGRDRIEIETGITPTSFASPFGDYDERVLGHIKRYYQSHLTAWGGHRWVNKGKLNEYEIERVNIDETLTSDEVCTMVSTVQEGEWLVLMFHQIRDLRSPDEPFVTTANHLASITACIKEAAEQKKISVGTVSAVIDHLNEE